MRVWQKEGALSREGLCGQKRIAVTKEGVTKRCGCGQRKKASIKKGVGNLQVGVASGGGAGPKKGVTKGGGCGQRRVSMAKDVGGWN